MRLSGYIVFFALMSPNDKRWRDLLRVNPAFAPRQLRQSPATAASPSAAIEVALMDG